MHCLECHAILLSHAPSTMRRHTETVVDNLMEISIDSKPQIKAELYRVRANL